MEQKTGFCIEEAILAWRQTLNGSEILSNNDLQELESHLRDGIAFLQGKGLTEVEAFLIARNRLGGAREIETEFKKADPVKVGLNHMMWMMVGVWAARLLYSVSLGLTNIGIVIGFHLGHLRGEALTIVSSLCQMAGPLLIIFVLWKCAGNTPRINEWKVKCAAAPILSACLLTGMLVAATLGSMGTEILSARTLPPEMMRLAHLGWRLNLSFQLAIWPIALAWIFYQQKKHDRTQLAK